MPAQYLMKARRQKEITGMKDDNDDKDVKDEKDDNGNWLGCDIEIERVTR